MARAALRFLLLDGFDPDTGELALRVAYSASEPVGPALLRLKLHLGRAGDALAPLKKELQNHVQMPLPPLWDRGLKVVIRAVEDELATPEGRQPARYTWVQTQVLHPADERRCTLNHPVARQVDILMDWAQRLEQEGEPRRALEFLERLLLLSPRHAGALARLTRLLRDEGMVAEALETGTRWAREEPRTVEAHLRRGEALVHLERPREALEAFKTALALDPLQVQAHLGAGQAVSLLGGDPFPHLDAAQELDAAFARAVLKETFDYRLVAEGEAGRDYAFAELPGLLGVSGAEVRAFIEQDGLPATPQGDVREAELARWVAIQNRYLLQRSALHWAAPTPRRIPELG
ncbi:MAG: tetratricopeptide repeat protein [Holophagaceae bacterium]